MEPRHFTKSPTARDIRIRSHIDVFVFPCRKHGTCDVFRWAGELVRLCIGTSLYDGWRRSLKLSQLSATVNCCKQTRVLGVNWRRSHYADNIVDATENWNIGQVQSLIQVPDKSRPVGAFGCNRNTL